MQSAVKLNIVIPSSHHVELILPETLPTGPAEIIILTSPRPQSSPRREGMGMDAGKGWVADDFDAPLPADLWAGSGKKSRNEELLHGSSPPETEPAPPKQ